MYNNLKFAGLSENELNTYVNLIKSGESTISNISKMTGINRTTLYLIIDNLIEKGFVKRLKINKKQYYYAENPNKFVVTMEENLHRVNEMIPGLLSIMDTSKDMPRVTFFEGEEAVKKIYRDTLLYPNSEILAWVSENIFGEYRRYVEYYIQQRTKKKI